MSIHNFIGASSALLLAWLGVTYFHKVPAERYPAQKSPTSAATSKIASQKDAIVATTDSDESNFR